MVCVCVCVCACDSRSPLVRLVGVYVNLPKAFCRSYLFGRKLRMLLCNKPYVIPSCLVRGCICSCAGEASRAQKTAPTLSPIGRTQSWCCQGRWLSVVAGCLPGLCLLIYLFLLKKALVSHNYDKVTNYCESTASRQLLSRGTFITGGFRTLTVKQTSAPPQWSDSSHYLTN